MMALHRSGLKNGCSIQAKARETATSNTNNGLCSRTEGALCAGLFIGEYVAGQQDAKAS
jgi:hypothetical protein